MNKLQVQTHYNLLYSDKIRGIDQSNNVNIQAISEKDTLDIARIFPISYQIGEENISIKILEQEQISGVVVDPQGMPLPEANIQLKNSDVGTVTDFNGKFSLLAGPG